jgi:hypothetical protein
VRHFTVPRGKGWLLALQILTIQEILAKSKLYRLFCQNASYKEENVSIL